MSLTPNELLIRLRRILPGSWRMLAPATAIERADVIAFLREREDHQADVPLGQRASTTELLSETADAIADGRHVGSYRRWADR